MFKFVRARNFFSQLKLNKKFLFMYIFGVILPLIITDAVLFRSVFEAELDNQRKYREDATNAYVNRIQDILDYDAQVAMAIDLNKDLNEFIDTEYTSILSRLHFSRHCQISTRTDSLSIQITAP